MSDCLPRRAAILMEMMVALAIFVMAGLTIGGSMRQGVMLAMHARHEARAADMARTAMALIEAGIESPQSLRGPVRPFLARVDAWDGDASADAERRSSLEIDESRLEDAGWELLIETEPSDFRGLTKVTVIARRVDDLSGAVLASARLTQLVALGPEADDTIGGESELHRQAVEGAAREERRSGQSERGRR
ncbi:MAG: hypothetical protein KF866_03005 [Phycisphaeraceae bacterium]|nr:hypothetical protein [Phycisphaeraceae bacterium]MCW5753335.1 hypothetical protein [Phycisphaeraceae bacterium]